MARCTDCIHFEACLKFADLRVILCGDKADTKCIVFKPATSVAPRAEIDKLQEVNADLNESLRIACEGNKDLQAEVDRLRFNLNAVLDERAEDKAEVARKIFEEIERFLKNQEAISENKRLKEVGDWIFHDYLPTQLAELKKKYTKPEPPRGEL